MTGMPRASAERAGGRANLRQAVDRHAEQIGQARVPLQRLEIHQAGARGGGDVGREPAGQAIEEEGIAGAEAQAPGAAQRLRLRHVVEQPAQLGWRRNRDRAAGRRASSVSSSAPSAFSRSVTSAGARILPDDGVVDRRAWSRASQATTVSPWLAMPMADASSACSSALSTCAISSSGSCSTQPCCG